MTQPNLGRKKMEPNLIAGRFGSQRWSKSGETSDFSALNREFDPDCKQMNNHSSYIEQLNILNSRFTISLMFLRLKLVQPHFFNRSSSHRGYKHFKPLGLGRNAAMPHPPLRSDAEGSPLSEPEILLQEPGDTWRMKGYSDVLLVYFPTNFPSKFNHSCR